MSSVTFKAGSAKRRNYRKRETTPGEDSPSTSIEAGDESLAQSKEEEELSLEELVELRKLRQRPTGIAATDLLLGDMTGKKKKKDKTVAPEDPWKMSSGGGLVDLEKVREGDKTKSTGILNSFTKQTNTLDVDKHMMKYIEEELKKRRGDTGDAEADSKEQAQEYHADTDILDELGIRRTAPKPEQEGNVQLSTTMLTAIPEVDLGMEARLKNIEETERAKRKLLAERSTTRINTERFSAPTYVPSDRERVSHHQQNNRRNNNNQNNSNQSNSQNSGMDAGIANHRFQNVGGDQNRRGGAGRGMATDDLVMERFKKRMRR